MVDMILFIWRTDVQCTCTYLVRPTDIMARASCRIAMFDKPNKYTSIPVREMFVNAAGLTIDNNAIDVVSHCYRSLIKLLSLVQHTHIQWHTDNTNNKCVWLNTFRILFGGPPMVYRVNKRPLGTHMNTLWVVRAFVHTRTFCHHERTINHGLPELRNTKIMKRKKPEQKGENVIQMNIYIFYRDVEIWPVLWPHARIIRFVLVGIERPRKYGDVSSPVSPGPSSRISQPENAASISASHCYLISFIFYLFVDHSYAL